MWEVLRVVGGSTVRLNTPEAPKSTKFHNQPVPPRLDSNWRIHMPLMYSPYHPDYCRLLSDTDGGFWGDGPQNDTPKRGPRSCFRSGSCGATAAITTAERSEVCLSMLLKSRASKQWAHHREAVLKSPDLSRESWWRKWRVLRQAGGGWAGEGGEPVSQRT